MRAGAIVRNGRAHRERDLLSARRRNVIEVNPAAGTGLEAGQVQDALAALDLDSLDLLLIENDVSMSRSGLQADLGQEATVAVFSVAAGDDKAYRHPEMIQSADAVVLNKLDLMRCVPFDDGAFTADVERVKPSVKLFPLSALHARGLEPWLTWLQRGVRKSRHTNEDASHWFG